jgi:cobalt-zinc-cadmium efflux system membrane fusion protein
MKAAVMNNLTSTFAALILLCLFNSSPIWASEGDDHGDAAPAATGNGPRRMPDGSVFLPKPSQRQLAVRTQVTEEKSLPQTVELNGRARAGHTGRAH